MSTAQLGAQQVALIIEKQQTYARKRLVGDLHKSQVERKQ